MLRNKLSVLVSFCCFAVSAVATADETLELAAPFTDNMILQRQAQVPVWGFDSPGSKVTVEFAGQTKTAVADQDGDWMVKLDPLTASREERSLKVTNDRRESIVLDRVLVGEVWFSSGQSNMVWTAGKSMCSGIAREIADSQTDIPIREININTVSALIHRKQPPRMVDGRHTRAPAVSPLCHCRLPTNSTKNWTCRSAFCSAPIAIPGSKRLPNVRQSSDIQSSTATPI